MLTEFAYGVAVLTAIVEVAVAPPPAAGVSVAPGTGVLLGVAAVGCAATGQANSSTGKSIQLPAVQILSVTGVLSGPLQSTTCLPLCTSTVTQLGVVAATEVVDVVVDGDGETISKVAVSGSTNSA
jgi:hypothetical protein